MENKCYAMKNMMCKNMVMCMAGFMNMCVFFALSMEMHESK